MADVILHIYDVTNSDSDKTNNTILQINRIFKDGIGLGGIFHSAIQGDRATDRMRFLWERLQGPKTCLRRFGNPGGLRKCHGILEKVYGEDEWSFGFCEQGTGVFSCPSGKNPMYTYRECIVLGKTNCSTSKVAHILRELGREWPGDSYDLLSRNCNHFCDELCGRLGVPRLPGWVNRFALAGDTAAEIAGNTALRLKQAKAEIVTASKVAYRFFAGVASNSVVGSDSADNTNGGGSIPRFQANWFKNLVSSVGAKPSATSDLENGAQQQQLCEAETPLHQNSVGAQ